MAFRPWNNSNLYLYLYNNGKIWQISCNTTDDHDCWYLKQEIERNFYIKYELNSALEIRLKIVFAVACE